MIKAFVTHKFELNGIHKLNLNNQNIEPLHGHHYKYYVTLSGAINKDSGVIYPHHVVQQIVTENINKIFNKKYLNEIIEYSSGEFLAKEIYDRLKHTLLGKHLHSIMINETTKNRFIYPCQKMI
ncbi:MAG: 6-carboxytetrahydropterin synthase [Bdellovibrionales bacterium]|nr:6-carboxytetrahydropterin synthase [Bdellovibrionales bacterium]